MKYLIYPITIPLSIIYGAVVWIINKLYDRGILKSNKFGIPVISVGNITVGGTGKTPHIEYLIALLGTQYKIAVLSRGYKRKSEGFKYVQTDDNTEKTGDEPLQIKRKYPNAIVAVDINRTEGIKKLQTDFPDLDLILLDDAMQHRQVTPSLNIVLINYNQPVWKDIMLPAGRLRDCKCSLKRADVIIITKCPYYISIDEQNKCIAKLKKYKKDIFFSNFEYGEELPVGNSNSVFNPKKIFAFAGIANPSSFFELLYNRYPKALVETTSYPDHHNFSEKDIQAISKKSETYTIVTTEKDSVRLISYFCITKQKPMENMFYIPLVVNINESEKFNAKIIEHVRKNQKHSRIY